MKQWQTDPRNRLDGLFWRFLRVIWEPFSRKQSHWWHWQDLPMHKIQDVPLFLIKGDAEAKSRNSWWSNFWQTNIGWKRCTVFQPLLAVDAVYRIGFMEMSGRTQICSMLLQGQVALLQGPESVRYFALYYPSDSPMCLHVVRERVHKSSLGKNIPLL